MHNTRRRKRMIMELIVFWFGLVFFLIGYAMVEIKKTIHFNS